MNKNSKVLALKYRPSNFDELIGQDLVAEQLLIQLKLIKFQMLIYLLELEE